MTGTFPSKERYPSDWNSVPSVTEVLGAFPGPELIAWFRRMAFAEQKVTSDKALDIGKTLHELRIRIEKGEPFEIVTKYPVEVQNTLKGYFQWKKERKIPPIRYSELQMFNPDLGIKGTFDDLAISNGYAVLLEYKTAKGIYDDAKEQVVIYSKLVTHHNTKYLTDFHGVFQINEIWVVRFGKETPDYESVQVKPSEIDELFESFNHKLKILNIRKRSKQNAEINDRLQGGSH